MVEKQVTAVRRENEEGKGEEKSEGGKDVGCWVLLMTLNNSLSRILLMARL